MKRLLSILLVLCLLTGCGGMSSSMEGPENVSDGVEYTEEALFLQEAYWYLQSDEKDLFTWENGILEDYCAEESQKIISPEGEMEIQGMDLRRVRYPYFKMDQIEHDINLYFDQNGQFVGTDGALYLHGDIQMWVFADKRRFTADETVTVTTVLKNWGDARSFTVYGAVTWQEFFKDGISVGGGVNDSGKVLELDENEVVVLESQHSDWEEWIRLQEGDVLPGKYAMVTCVDMHEALDGTFGGTRGVGVRLQEIRELELTA